MNNIVLDKITAKINKRTVAIVAQGGSIYELEHRIEDFKHYDICWASFNFFSIIDTFILNKIGKRLEIVLEAADSDNVDYEVNHRIPSIVKIIERGDLFLSTWRLMRTEYEKKGLKDFYETHKDKILLADDLLDIISVPNTMSILIYCIALAQPKKIILFGVDGYNGRNNEDEYSTYFMPALAKQRRERMLQHRKNFTLRETTNDFERDFNIRLKEYCNKFNVSIPEILNCSPNSIFTCIRKITYDDLKSELERK